MIRKMGLIWLSSPSHLSSGSSSAACWLCSPPQVLSLHVGILFLQRGLVIKDMAIKDILAYGQGLRIVDIPVLIGMSVKLVQVFLF